MYYCFSFNSTYVWKRSVIGLTGGAKKVRDTSKGDQECDIVRSSTCKRSSCEVSIVRVIAQKISAGFVLCQQEANTKVSRTLIGCSPTLCWTAKAKTTIKAMVLKHTYIGSFSPTLFFGFFGDISSAKIIKDNIIFIHYKIMYHVKHMFTLCIGCCHHLFCLFRGHVIC